jgi:hypothetical protein
MTPQTIIQTARQVVNDNDSAGYRQSDPELLKYVNDGLKEACNLSPDTFLTTGDFVCTAGQTEQRITFADAKELRQVIRIKDGKAVHPMDMEAMSAFNPDWASDTAAAAQNWTRFAGDPLRFYLYPKAPAQMQTLEVSYVKNPDEYALNDTIGDVPATWESALADYVIYRVESKDDEHVISARAVSHYNAFVQKITGLSPAQEGA